MSVGLLEIQDMSLNTNGNLTDAIAGYMKRKTVGVLYQDSSLNCDKVKYMIKQQYVFFFFVKIGRSIITGSPCTAWNNHYLSLNCKHVMIIVNKYDSLILRRHVLHQVLTEFSLNPLSIIRVIHSGGLKHNLHVLLHVACNNTFLLERPKKSP